MVSTTTTNKSIEKPGSGDYPNTWNVPVNSDWDIIDRAFGGVQVMNPTGVSGTVVLTTTQYQPQILVVGASISATATLTANVNYQIPSGIGGIWTVYNNTSGAFSITISSGGGGNSVIVAQGKHTLIYSDGTNIQPSENSSSVIPSGSHVLFYESYAPTGWTQYTAINNRALRIVSGAGGGLGGTTPFTSVFTARTITVSNMPSHNHTGSTDVTGLSGHLFQQGNRAGLSGGDGVFSNSAGLTGYAQTSTGGAFVPEYIYMDASHGHTFSTGFTGGGTAMDFAVQYADVIICTKD